jgi:transcription antitermination factor NusG
VRIKAGPFAEFRGRIGSISDDGRTLRVIISVFQRDTSVDLGLHEVRAE